MYCRNCGDQMPDKATFCGNCGAPFPTRIARLDQLNGACRAPVSHKSSRSPTIVIAMLAVVAVTAIAATAYFWRMKVSGTKPEAPALRASETPSRSSTAPAASASGRSGAVLGRIEKSAKAVRAQSADSYTNSIGMEFVLIPAGEFWMGAQPPCPRDDPPIFRRCMERYPDNLPRHKIRISRPYYMGKFEVTQRQWYQVMGNNPAYFRPPNVPTGSWSHPIENVSWVHVREFLRKLNQLEKTEVYRLPTEAEWEYAARGGTDTEMPGGKVDAIGLFGWHRGNSESRTHPVGLKKPNPWGLYDTLGNVYEWCSDWYDEGYYRTSPNIDPLGPSSGTKRVFRGGADYGLAPFDSETGVTLLIMSVSTRGQGSPDFGTSDIGFRTVRELVAPPSKARTNMGTDVISKSAIGNQSPFRTRVGRRYAKINDLRAEESNEPHLAN